MTKNVKYVGTSDGRGITASDLKKAGVEEGILEGFEPTMFMRGTYYEMPDQVAEALIDNESGLFEGEFEEATEEDLAEVERNRPVPDSDFRDPMAANAALVAEVNAAGTPDPDPDPDPDGTQTKTGSTAESLVNSGSVDVEPGLPGSTPAPRGGVTP